MAAQATVPHWEARLFSAVNDLSNVWWVLVWGPMQLGSFLGSLVVVGLTGVISRDRRLTLAALVGSQAAYWTALAVKNLVSRGRPTAFFTEVHLHDQATGFGYVSGHAAVAFALAAVLAPSLPRAWRAVVMRGSRSRSPSVGSTPARTSPSTWSAAPDSACCAGTLARWAFGLGGEGLPVARSATNRRVSSRVGPQIRLRRSRTWKHKPARQDRQPVRHQPVAQHRGHRDARLHAHAGEAGDERRLHGTQARPASARRRR